MTTRDYRTGVRVADQVKWAKEILSIYEPESLRGV